MGKKETFLKILVVLSYTAMLFVNAIAVILPINGRATLDVFDYYPNLFMPADISYNIWVLIYLLFAFYLLYQLGLFGTGSNNADNELLNRSRITFIITRMLNIGWIFAWHYDYMAFSLMLTILKQLCFLWFSKTIRKEYLTTREKLLIKLPFSVSYGWATIAVVSHTVILLVSIGWDGFGIPEPAWIVLLIAMLTAFVIHRGIRNKDFAYYLAVLWAYIGILLRHMENNGFAGHYPVVIVALISGMIAIAVGIIYLLFFRRIRSA